ncbi:NACHT domain-containing protein [Fibrobacter sp.]|uniref:NACHT domain-containing protein n=1 Tax=Fibrobacter sp. TaxID=35828 RepID=UPI0038639D5C
MEVDFYKIRKTSKGQRDSFESLVCSLFHKKFEQLGEYQCYRGDGGDGGVEAIFICPDNSEIGVQAKFWENNEFGSSQKSQLDDSLKTALEKHPKLKTYYVAIPFDLTGNVSAGKRKSQTQRFDEWKSKSEELYSIKIELWSKSILCDILQEVDASKGLQRYWFDENILTGEQRLNHIRDAKSQAGEKYTPDLNVGVPLMNTLDSFTNVEFLNKQCNDRIRTIQKDFLEDSYFQEALGESCKCVCQSICLIIDLLKNLVNRKNVEESCKNLVKSCQELFPVLEKGEQEQLQILKNKFGDKFVDNERFRQFQAQYMCDFPAAKLDKIREFKTFLSSLLYWMDGDSFRVSYSNFLAIKGPAGIGKTFCVIDYVEQNKDCAHYIFYGDDFNNDEPWRVILNKLGLSATISREELFGSLDACAENLGKTSVIFIDALNESGERKKWKKWLAPLINQISSYPHLKLCVTCRDTYWSDVFREEDKYIVVEHNGFWGQEQKAIRAFFKHYKLNEPIYPLFNQEFGNPLFLRLFCESFKNESFADFPKGKIGLKTVYQRYIDKKTRLIADACDLDPDDDWVRMYLDALAEEMTITQKRFVERGRAKDIAKKLHKTDAFAQSLFSQMEKEGLLSFYNYDSKKIVRFSYDRMADYFVAQKLLCDEKQLGFALNNSEWLERNAGTLEMLAILLPEEKNKELCDCFSETEKDLWFLPFVRSLSWRSNESLTRHTKEIIGGLVKDAGHCEDTWLSCLSVATIPDNPLNINFFEETFLFSREVCNRDPVFSFVFRNGYEENKSVFKIIDLALNQENLRQYSDDSLFLWAKTLCWFLAHPDRRIRDKSSKALVRILLTNLRLSAEMLNHFEDIDDEYITERIIESVYASVLLSRNVNYAIDCARKIISMNFMGKYENVIIHDACRLIIEFAYMLDSNFISKDEFEVLVSKWPNKHFEKVDENVYQLLVQKEEFASRHINFVGHWYTDFQCYVLVNKIDDFDLESKDISYDDVYKWFVVELSKLGYPGDKSKCWIYDTQTLNDYGFDRMRAVYAERLSKKYYWILLRRLVGLLQNTVQRKKKSWDDSPEPTEPRLYSLDLRQIDLTDIRYNCEHKYPSLIWSIPSFKSKETNEEWLNGESDFFDADSVIGELKDEKGNSWIPLHLYKDEKLRSQDSDYNYKDSCMLVVAYLSTKEYIESLSKDDLDYFISGAPMQGDSNEYQLYLGEYPIARSYYEKVECNEISECNSRFEELCKTSFEFLRGTEWEYDCSYSDLDENEKEKLAGSIKFPSKKLIESLKLRWDGNSGWFNLAGQLICFQDKSGLFIAKDSLINLLGDDNALLMNVYREKIYSENGKSGLKAIRRAYKWSNNGIECIREREE